MNGYSKMKTISDTKSRSMDFSSDLISLSSFYSETQNFKPKTLETYLGEQIKNKAVTTSAAAAAAATATSNNKNSNKTEDSLSFSKKEEEKEGGGGGGGEEDHQECNTNFISNHAMSFGRHMKLNRSSTVSASSDASHALQSTVKRVFSMRRSSSVSERYRRIHDQSVTLASPIEDEDITVMNMKKKKKSNKSKIIKACKKLFGL